MATYINPGYGQLVTQGSRQILTHKNSTYNPRFGVALSLPDTDNDIDDSYVNPSIPVTFSGNKIFIKFDMYIPIIGDDDDTICNCFDLGDRVSFFFPSPATNDLAIESPFRFVGRDTNLKQGEVNHIWIYYAGYKAIVNVNGETIMDNSVDERWAYPVSSTVSFVVQETTPISNIIISDEYVDPREVIVELNASAVDTTMTIDGAQYKAVEGDAYVLQTPDISNARGLFGNSGKILGLAAIAAPAYTTGDDVTSLKCRTVDGETVTDYSAQNLSSDTSAMLAEYLPVSSDMTVASLANFKIGWVTL